MPSGMSSAILLAILIGAGLLVLIPSLIFRSDSPARVQRPVTESTMRVLPRAAGSSQAEQELRAKAETFVAKVARNTSLDAGARRELIAWLATPAWRRGTPSKLVTRVLAVAGREPFRQGDAWLVRAMPQERPDLTVISNEEFHEAEVETPVRRSLRARKSRRDDDGQDLPAAAGW